MSGGIMYWLIVVVWVLVGIYKTYTHTLYRTEWPSNSRRMLAKGFVFLGSLVWPLEFVVLCTQVAVLAVENPNHIDPVDTKCDERYIYSIYCFFKLRGYLRYYQFNRCPRCNNILELLTCSTCEDRNEVLGRYSIWISSRYQLLPRINDLSNELVAQSERLIDKTN